MESTIPNFIMYLAGKKRVTEHHHVLSAGFEKIVCLFKVKGDRRYPRRYIHQLKFLCSLFGKGRFFYRNGVEKRGFHEGVFSLCVQQA